MLKLISGVAIAIALMFAPSLARAADGNCPSQAEFLALAKKAEPKVLDLLPAHKEALTKVALKETGMTFNAKFKYSVDVAALKGGNVGIVILVNGCYRGQYSFMIDPGTFDQWLVKAGISDLDWRDA